MKYSILIAAFFVFICNVTAQDNDSLLFWNNNVKLNWDDFRGTAPDTTFNDVVALSYVLFQSDALYYGPPYFEVYAIFDRSKSWSITSDDNVLIHEQVHFDIGELYVRKIRKAFKELMNSDSPSETYSNVIYDLAEECKKYNDLYDNDTHYGIVEYKQKLWKERIAKELNDLKEYENADY